LPGRRPVSPKRAAHDARKASTTKQAATAKVFQLKVTSRDIKPPIWRRVLVDRSETLDECRLAAPASGHARPRTEAQLWPTPSRFFFAPCNASRTTVGQ